MGSESERPQFISNTGGRSFSNAPLIDNSNEQIVVPDVRISPHFLIIYYKIQMEWMSVKSQRRIIRFGASNLVGCKLCTACQLLYALCLVLLCRRRAGKICLHIWARDSLYLLHILTLEIVSLFMFS